MQLSFVSYEDLAFYLEDSRSFRRFCRYGIGDSIPKKSTLQANISRIRPETWKAINDILVTYAIATGLERGDKVRLDCTAVDANIAEPADSNLLYETVRVIAREMKQAEKKPCWLYDKEKGQKMKGRGQRADQN